MAVRPPPGARKAPLPATLPPQLATPSPSPPGDSGWFYEMKLDGYRLLARSTRSGVTLHTRSGADWSAKLPHLVAALEALRLGDAWVDGEIVVLGSNGVPSFQLLQNAFDARGTSPIRYYVFDLPFHGGLDLREVRQDARRERLRSLLSAKATGPVVFSEAFDEPVEALFLTACRLQLEGLIAKRADAPYVSARTKAWLKLKCRLRQEFVIGGFTAPQGSRSGFGALLLGVHEKGRLRYAGRVGTGFDERSLAKLHAMLATLAVREAPFADPPRGADARGVTWVEPKLLCEVEFAEWTQDGAVRHAAFLGLRTDKPPVEITREAPVPPPDADAAGYYAAIAEAIVPHLKGRSPHGSKRALLDAARSGVVEFTATTAPLGKAGPDRIAFALEPDTALPWARVLEAAELLRALLEELGLASFVKTSGGAGLHVLVPVRGRVAWEQAGAFAEAVAAHLASTLSERFTAQAARRARSGKVFVDTRANAPGSALIAPWSARREQGHPVSMPVAWEDLVELKGPREWSTANAVERWRERGDAWKDLEVARSPLAAAAAMLAAAQSPEEKPSSKRTLTVTPRAIRSRA